MGKLLEVIRRLAIVGFWCVGSGLAFLTGAQSVSCSHYDNLRGSFAILVVTFIAHKIVNWMLLSDEKMLNGQTNEGLLS